jgi:hypothetical protein
MHTPYTHMCAYMYTHVRIHTRSDSHLTQHTHMHTCIHKHAHVLTTVCFQASNMRTSAHMPSAMRTCAHLISSMCTVALLILPQKVHWQNNKDSILFNSTDHKSMNTPSESEQEDDALPIPSVVPKFICTDCGAETNQATAMDAHVHARVCTCISFANILTTYQLGVLSNKSIMYYRWMCSTFLKLECL